MTQKNPGKSTARWMQKIVEAEFGHRPAYVACLNLVTADSRQPGESVEARARRLVGANPKLFDPKEA